MYIYIVVFIFIYSFILFDMININSKMKKILLGMLMVTIALFVGLRMNVGADYIGYNSYFTKTTMDLNSEFEIGFQIFIVLTKKIYNSFNFFLLITSFLTFSILYKSIINIRLGYFIPFYIFSIQYLLGGPMGQIRQALSIAIVLYSLKYILRKKFKKFSLTIFIASSFHITSIVFIFAYMVNFIKLNKKKMIIFLIFVIFIGYSAIIRKTLIYITNLIDLDIFDYLRNYIESDRYGVPYSGSIIAYIERFAVFLVSLFLFSKSDKKEIKILIQIYWLSLIFFFLFKDISILAQRISRPFKMVEIFLYPYIISKLSNNRFEKVLIYIVLSLLIYKPIYIIRARPYQYIPYDFFNLG